MSCYSDEVAADSPALYWPLDETDGPTVADDSGNGLDGAFGTGSLSTNNILQNSTRVGPSSLASAVLDGSGELAIAITTPSPLQTGDLRYVAIACIGGTSVDLPANTTVIDESDVNGVFCGLYEEEVTAPSTATYTVHGSAGAQAVWSAWRYFAASGRTAKLSRSSFVVSTPETAVTDHDVPSRTIIDRWDVLVNVVMGRIYDPQITEPYPRPPAGMTDRSPEFLGDGVPFVGLAHQGVYYDPATSGATGVRTWTLTDSHEVFGDPDADPASMDVYGIALLLQPDPVPGPEPADRLVTGCDSDCPDIEVPFFARHDSLAGEFVSLVGTSPLNGLNTWSAEVWFYVDPIMVSIGRVWAIGNHELRVDPTIDPGRVRVTISGSSGTRSTEIGAKVGCWNHVAVVSSNAENLTHLYINGVEVLVDSVLPTTKTLITGTAARIGTASSGASSFRGNLGHFALYDTALSAGRLAARVAYGCGVCREAAGWNVGAVVF